MEGGAPQRHQWIAAPEHHPSSPTHTSAGDFKAFTPLNPKPSTLSPHVSWRLKAFAPMLHERKNARVHTHSKCWKTSSTNTCGNNLVGRLIDGKVSQGRLIGGEARERAACRPPPCRTSYMLFHPRGQHAKKARFDAAYAQATGQEG